MVIYRKKERSLYRGQKEYDKRPKAGWPNNHIYPRPYPIMALSSANALVGIELGYCACTRHLTGV